MAKSLLQEELIDRINSSIELLDKEFTTKELGLTYPQISHWHLSKLIPFKIPESKWHSFSFLEACWLKMIYELRSLGLPIAAIKLMRDEIAATFEVKDIINTPERIESLKQIYSEEEVKKFLAFAQTSGSDSSPKQFASTQFGLFIMQCIVTRSPVFLLIASTGDFFWVDQQSLDVAEFREAHEDFKEKPHVSININQIIASVLLMPTDNQQKFYNSILSYEENELISILRSNLDADQINIRLKKGKYDKTIDLVELQKTEKIDPLARITQLFLKDGYEEVSLITEKGIIKSVKRKRKIKL